MEGRRQNGQTYGIKIDFNQSFKEKKESGIETKIIYYNQF